MDNTKKENKPVIPTDIPKPIVRTIVIETDGNTIRITKAEVAGLIELKGILETILKGFEKKP